MYRLSRCNPLPCSPSSLHLKLDIFNTHTHTHTVKSPAAAGRHRALCWSQYPWSTARTIASEHRCILYICYYVIARHVALCHRIAVFLLMGHASAWLLFPKSNVPVWFHRPHYVELCTCPPTGARQVDRYTHTDVYLYIENIYFDRFPIYFPSSTSCQTFYRPCLQDEEIQCGLQKNSCHIDRCQLTASVQGNIEGV